jgi:hypothetical protein
MRLTLATALLACLAFAPAHAQQSQAPDMSRLTPQDAARLNAAVGAADDKTKAAFGEVEKKLKEAGHPSGMLLEKTKQ